MPVFGVVLTGYLAGRFEMLGSDSAAALNRFVFYFALPPALFIFMARAPAEKIFNWPFIGAFVGGELATLLIALVVGRFWFHQDGATRTVAGLSRPPSKYRLHGIAAPADGLRTGRGAANNRCHPLPHLPIH